MIMIRAWRMQEEGSMEKKVPCVVVYEKKSRSIVEDVVNHITVKSLNLDGKSIYSRVS